jgi:putative tryptophan/tyrosine transport system substrate-binding protein
MKSRLAVLSISLLLWALCLGPARAGQEILAIQSIRIQPYEEALNGFESTGIATVRRLVISEMAGASVLEKIREIKPALVLAVGMDALKQAGAITDVPVIHLMVLNPPAGISEKRNVHGVRMNIPPEQQIRAILDVLPATKAIGLLYNPERTGDLAEKTREAARRSGVKMVAKAVRQAKNVPNVIRELKGQIDLFLMLPDLTVVTPDTVETLLLFSLEQKIPLVTFSEKYVEMGALLSIGSDPFDMGAQAGEMAQQILSGRDMGNNRQVEARKTMLSINRKAAKLLGIAIAEKTLRKANAVD